MLELVEQVKASEWEIRLQPLEDVLQTYRVRHRECVNSKKLPGKYIVVRMEDKDAGIGNQLPSVVSGMHCLFPSTCSFIVSNMVLCPPREWPPLQATSIVQSGNRLLNLAVLRGSAIESGCGCVGFLLALLMERCLFVDFPFFNKYFEHELDFSWANHYERLLKFGHNATAPENIAQRIPYGYVSIADLWMFKDMKESFNADYGVEMWKDLDWSAALLQSNPNHQVQFSVLLLLEWRRSFLSEQIHHSACHVCHTCNVSKFRCTLLRKAYLLCRILLRSTFLRERCLRRWPPSCSRLRRSTRPKSASSGTRTLGCSLLACR